MHTADKIYNEVSEIKSGHFIESAEKSHFGLRKKLHNESVRFYGVHSMKIILFIIERD